MAPLPHNSASALDRFETEMLTQWENLSALTDLPGRWIDAAHGGRSTAQVDRFMKSDR